VTFFKGLARRGAGVSRKRRPQSRHLAVNLLPDELAAAVGGMMDHAAGFMKKALEAM
jgi:hypothetical protein